MSITTTHPAPTRPAHRTAGVFGELNTEWDIQLSHQPAPWASTWEDTELETAQDFLDALLHAGKDTARTDAVLLQMLQASWAGDDLATRAVLQTMLGAAGTLANSLRRRHINDPDALAICAYWHAVTTFPRHIHAKIAATLRMQALNYVHQRSSREAAEQACIPVGVTTADWESTPLDAQGRPSTANPQDVARTEAADLLRWAQDIGVLTDKLTQVIALRHLQEPAPSWKIIAEQLTITPATARQRYHRAVGALTTAVRDHLDP